MKASLKIKVIVLMLLTATVSLFAQTEKGKADAFGNYSRLLSGEKVYLHTDKDVYGATDTIWISGYVENSSYLCEFNESNFLYVELLCDIPVKDLTSWSNSSKYEHLVIDRRKLKRIGDTFQGYIVVPEMNSTGKATLRGYTYWMLNSPPQYMFYKELEIINPMKDKAVASVQANNINFRDAYTLLGEAPPKKKAQPVTQEQKNYDVQFLPESGYCIAGAATSVIYIKSIGEDGLGKPVFGEIFSPAGKMVATYSTDSRGFGKVVVNNIPQGKLSATVKDAGGYYKVVPFPAPQSAGVTINGELSFAPNNADTRMRLRISASEELLSNGLTAMIHNGSEVYYQKAIVSQQNVFSLVLGPLTPGIHSVSVTDSKGNVYAERPFVVLPVEREMARVSTDRQQYGKKEKVTVTVSLPEGLPYSDGNFSISVTDMGVVEDKEKSTIKSYMLLQSELEGYIEDVDYYFNDSVPYPQRMHRADMLMQTQGWRYYDLQNILKGHSSAPVFGREYIQTISGKIQGLLGLSKKAHISFLAPSINLATMGQVDSGYFVLQDIDFPEGTRFIAMAAGKNGKSQSHTPILQGDFFAPVYSYPVKKEKVVYSERLGEVVEKRYYNNENNDHAMTFTLNPVIVTSQYITPKNSPSPLANHPLKRTSFRDVVAMKPYSTSYDISSYIAASFPGVRRDVRTGMLLGHKTPTTWSTVEVYLNGIYIPYNEVYNTNLLQTPLSDVESIAYVTGLEATSFQPIHLMFSNYPSPVLMIRTKVDIATYATPANVDVATPIGWQKPAKFYSPKYESRTTGDKEDNRLTIYWNPSMQFNNKGEAVVTFYTSDSNTNYRIEVQGRSSAGTYHYVEKIVKRK